MSTTLKRLGPGAYSGTWRGEDYQVVRQGDGWMAVYPPHDGISAATIEGAAYRAREAIDMAQAEVPELEALLRRWATEVRAITAQIDACEPRVALLPIDLQADLERADFDLRRAAARFDLHLAELREVVGLLPEQSDA